MQKNKSVKSDTRCHSFLATLENHKFLKKFKNQTSLLNYLLDWAQEIDQEDFSKVSKEDMRRDFYAVQKTMKNLKTNRFDSDDE